MNWAVAPGLASAPSSPGSLFAGKGGVSFPEANGSHRPHPLAAPRIPGPQRRRRRGPARWPRRSRGCRRPPQKQPWPTTLSDQVRAVKEALRATPLQTPAQIAAHFRPASRTRIAEILETLTTLGQTRESAGRYSL
jgi:hypothetical protein